MLGPTTTIAAIATAAGPAAVSIIRISGPEVPAIIRAVATSMPRPRYASLQAFRAPNGTLIDRGLLLYFQAPASYTGEEMAEFQIHGGPAVVQQLLRAVYAAGAQPAAPGEFSKRAYLNGKLDLLQAEAVADLIAANTERNLNAANLALAGQLSLQVKVLAEELVTARALLEATIDFAEEVLDDAASLELFERISRVRASIGLMRNSARHGALLARGISAVILGEPNVGKSSLLNTLAGHTRAIVNSRAGTTRDVLSVDLDFDGAFMTLHDTAGIRATMDEVELEGIARAHAKAETADLVIYLYTSETPDPRFIKRIQATSRAASKLLCVRNKIDLLDLVPSRRMHDGHLEVSLSAATGAGIPLLRAAVLELLELNVDAATTPLLARERHLEALRLADGALAFTSPVELVLAPEISAERLRQAQQALSELTGEVTNEDLLGAIFSRFCIGK